MSTMYKHIFYTLQVNPEGIHGREIARFPFSCLPATCNSLTCSYWAYNGTRPNVTAERILSVWLSCLPTIIVKMKARLADLLSSAVKEEQQNRCEQGPAVTCQHPETQMHKQLKKTLLATQWQLLTSQLGISCSHRISTSQWDWLPLSVTLPKDLKDIPNILLPPKS